MSLIDDFDRRFLLGVPAMDRNHREFVELVNSMAEASHATFAYLYSDLLNHTRAHFASEEVMMRRSGFPEIAEHSREHARVLQEMTENARHLGDGQIMAVRTYVCEQLPDWFERHAVGMDSALATHLNRDKALKQPV